MAGTRGEGSAGDPVLRSDPPSTLVQEPFPVTGPASGGTERGTGAPSRATGTQGAVGAILVVLALGLALRLIIAYLLPGSGFEVDLGRVPVLGGQARDERPVRASTSATSSTTTRPATCTSCGWSGIVGNARRRRRRPDQDPADPRRPGDRLARLVDGPRARRAATASRSAARFVAVLNPITWFDSVVWGQVDSFGVVFLLLGLRELWRDRPERAAIYTVIAAIIKPQLGILVPLVAVVTIRRALWPAGGERRPASGTGPTRSRDPDDRPRGLPDRGRPSCLPFGLSVIEFTPIAPFIRPACSTRSASQPAATRT